MIKLLLFIRLLSFNLHALNRDQGSPQFQEPVPVNADISIPSVDINEGQNLDAVLREDGISISKEKILAPQDVFLQKDLPLTPVSHPKESSPASLRSEDENTGKPQTFQVGGENGRSQIHSKAWGKLKYFASKFLKRGLGQKSFSSLWDGDAFKGERDGQLGSLLARGPPAIIEVRNAGEVAQAIPNTNAALEHFREQLMEAFWNGEIHSIKVYHYPGGQGGDIITVDVSHSPTLVEILPDLLPHERRLLESLLKSGVSQLQVVLIEGGVREQSTPDLVLDGKMAEMKSVHSMSSFPLFLNKANSQIYKHAERHGLGLGTVVINLTDDERVPVLEILKAIESWREIPEGDKVASPYQGKHPNVKHPLAVERIEVFARQEHRVFVRGADGNFRVL